MVVFMSAAYARDKFFSTENIIKLDAAYTQMRLIFGFLRYLFSVFFFYFFF